ncbi:type I DNA topoisomerase [Patescibacteria group bacterium]|nr:type I DNA topoisomerase [Patescibacteria group bacterium]
MQLVIVESPTKAKTIRKFLGSEYHVLASMGHVRDLPETAADVPEEFKKTPKGKLGVDVDHDFEPLYLIPKSKTKTVSELKKLIKDASAVYLATDEDREGESISWHLLQILKPKVPVHRLVFHEITKSAIEHALAHPRDLDENLVHAQETRRILDRLVGYTVSPVLWKKIAFGLSAGRVQSAVLKAIVDRERDRMRFVKSSYWDVEATLEHTSLPFDAKLISSEGTRIASGKDFDEDTGAVKEKSNVLLLDEDKAKVIAAEAKDATWTVQEVTEKPVTRRPPPPFITSTLQQDGNRKLGLTSKETMKLAQGLYERGFITYMRTDSTSLSPEAVTGIRSAISSRFGAEFLPPAPRTYSSSTKGAQEAHEAIRPSLTFTAPHDTDLMGAERDLYELIWMRTLASQMEDAKQLQVSVLFDVKKHVFQATGMRILFPGFLRAYVEGSEDTDQALQDKERHLPALSVGQSPTCKAIEAIGHETKPPARFTEASLVQFMEKEGIGRPSTYAATISTLTDRNYTKKQGGTLIPTFTGFAVTQYMESHFGDLVNISFTSQMEQRLDQIAEGKEGWLPYLQEFYRGTNGLEQKVADENARGKDDGPDPRQLIFPQLPDTRINIGRFGAYIEGIHPRSQTYTKASLPVDMTPGELTSESINELLSTSQQGPTTLGEDPASHLQIYLKTGAYGPYLQLGEDPEDPKIKPKRVSIPKQVPLETLDRARALDLLALPRLVGLHPETQEEIRAGFSRFGPYIVYKGEFRSVKNEDILTLPLARALEILAEPKGARRGAAALRTVGEHPSDKQPITLHSGKFGMYVKHGKTNATVPKDTAPESVTLEQAIQLLEERTGKTKTKTKAVPKKPRAKKAKKTDETEPVS